MVDLPRILNIGSGKDFREDALNIDINPLFKPDIVMDIVDREQVFDAEYPIDRLSGGRFRLPQGYFDKIIANDILEHVSDLVITMTHCRDLLRMEGEMEIIVPYDLSVGAWSDPTHVRAFNERSWIYYAEWAWYLGWKDSCFACTKCELQVADWVNKSISVKEVSRMPRAVDSMKVTLKKVKYVQPETVR